MFFSDPGSSCVMMTYLSVSLYLCISLFVALFLFYNRTPYLSPHHDTPRLMRHFFHLEFLLTRGVFVFASSMCSLEKYRSARGQWASNGHPLRLLMLCCEFLTEKCPACGQVINTCRRLVEMCFCLPLFATLVTTPRYFSVFFYPFLRSVNFIPLFMFLCALCEWNNTLLLVACQSRWFERIGGTQCLLNVVVLSELAVYLCQPVKLSFQMSLWHEDNQTRQTGCGVLFPLLCCAVLLGVLCSF